MPQWHTYKIIAPGANLIKLLKFEEVVKSTIEVFSFTPPSDLKDWPQSF
jgi:hypothetical protein